MNDVERWLKESITESEYEFALWLRDTHPIVWKMIAGMVETYGAEAARWALRAVMAYRE